MEIPTPALTGFGRAPQWVPGDACTLPTVEQPLRAAEFDSLFASALRDTERLDPRRARLVLTGDATLTDRVQSLVSAESSCCSFFTFTVTPLPAYRTTPLDQPAATAVALTIGVPEARAEVLEALLTRAEQAPRVAS